MVVCRLQQDAAADAFHVDGVLTLVPRRFSAFWPFNLHQPHIGLGLEDLQRFRCEGGSHQHLDELLDDQLCCGLVQRAVERNDAAKGAGRVSLERLAVGVGGIFAYRHAAGVGVLDDDTGRCLELLDAFPRGVGVGDVVVAELLALQLFARDDAARRRIQVAVQRGLLVAVFSIAQILHLHEHAVALRRELHQLWRAIGVGGIESDG